MSDNKCSCFGAGSSTGAGRETICIDTYRVLDSCRDRDCYEDVRVYLTSLGQEVIEHTCNVRAKCATILWTFVGVDPVQFNRGFYQITIRSYVKITFEACVSVGRAQEFDGLAVIEKRVILYGSEGSVQIFRSMPGADFCTPVCGCESETNLPIGVAEIANPIILCARVVEPSHGCNCCYCCCSCESIPEEVRHCFMGDFIDDDQYNRLYVSLGIFSVIRIERPAQYLITASDYAVPDKQCTEACDEDPCSLFRSMAFPTQEFSPPSLSAHAQESHNCGCGSKKDNSCH